MAVILISALMAAGFAVSAFLITQKWNAFADDPLGFNLDELRIANNWNDIWPDDHKFMSLKFSLFRHMLAGIISVIIMQFFSSWKIVSILPELNLLYALAKCKLYMDRKKDWAMRGDTTKKMLTPVKKACYVTVIYSFYVFILSFVFYGIRP